MNRNANRNAVSRRSWVAAATFATVVVAVGAGCGDQTGTGTGSDEPVGFQPASDNRNGGHGAGFRKVHVDDQNQAVAEFRRSQQERSHQSAPSSAPSGARVPDSRP